MSYVVSLGMKLCVKCGTQYDDVAAAFSWKTLKNGERGFRDECKACCCQYARERTASDPERVRRLARESKARHIEQRREDNRKHYRENRDAYLANVKKWRADNPIAHRAMRVNRRARLYGSGEAITEADFDTIVQASEGRCYWCDALLVGKDCHTDHVMPFKLGGKNERNNIVLACDTCNARKNCRHPSDFNAERWLRFQQHFTMA